MFDHSDLRNLAPAELEALEEMTGLACRLARRGQPMASVLGQVRGALADLPDLREQALQPILDAVARVLLRESLSIAATAVAPPRRVSGRLLSRA